MKIVVALAAALAVNLAVLGALERSVALASQPPAGEVLVVELPDASAAYAQLEASAARGAVQM